MQALVAAMSVVVLWTWGRSVVEVEQLSRPDVRDTVWHVVQVSHMVHRLGESARDTQARTTSQGALRIQLDLLHAQLAAVHEFGTASLLEFDGRQELAFIEHRIAGWQDQLDAQRGGMDVTLTLAGEIVDQDRVMRRAALDLLTKTHLEVSRRRDAARLELQHGFVTQALAMAGLVGGLGMLALGMRGQYRRVAQMATDLRTLNQTLEQRVEERTRDIEDRQMLLQSVLEASPSAVALIRSADGQALYANAPMLHALGLTRVPDAPMPLAQLFVDHQRAGDIEAELRLRHRLDGWEAEVAGPAGFPAVVHAREVCVNGEPADLVWLHDHSAWKALEEELRLRATTDGLTGLLNRRFFMDSAAQALNACVRYGHPCSALMLDADHFKAVNDQHGHLAGDEVLAGLARAMRSVLRQSDLIARYGGEEFVALLPHTDAGAALATAQRLRERCADLGVASPQGAVRVTASIGVATWRTGETLTQLVARADAALYAAKQRGRDQCAADVLSEPAG